MYLDPDSICENNSILTFSFNIFILLIQDMSIYSKYFLNNFKDKNDGYKFYGDFGSRYSDRIRIRPSRTGKSESGSATLSAITAVFVHSLKMYDLLTEYIHRVGHPILIWPMMTKIKLHWPISIELHNRTFS